MTYRVEDWVWTPDRQWKIMVTLYSANMTLWFYKHISDQYGFFEKENLEQVKRDLENEIQHLERALELEKEYHK